MANNHSKLKVLVVENCQMTRKIVARMFTKHLFEVTECYDGYKALEYLSLGEDGEDTGTGSEVVEEFDLIMTDHDMDGVNGSDLLRIVKKSSRKDIPVAIMSAYEGYERIQSCKAEGAISYMIKPIRDEHIKGLKGLIEESKVKKSD